LTRFVVAAAIAHTLENLRLAYPELKPQKRKELSVARRLLQSKDTSHRADVDVFSPASLRWQP
jgi:hypothetical protein